MSPKKTVLGIIAAGLVLSTVACDYSVTHRKTTDGKTVGVEAPAAPQAKKEETKKDTEPVTIADFAGTWKATKYVITKNNQTGDLIEMKIYESVDMVVGKDGSATASVAPMGKAKQSVSFKLVLDSGKLHFKGLDKSQEVPFDFALEGDSMNWEQPPFDDDVTQISWERVSKDANVPQFLTLDDIAGTWHATSLVITDSGDGSKLDFLKAGGKMDVVIEKDSTLSIIVTDPNGKVATQNKLKLAIKDGKHLLYSKDDAAATLDGNVMHLTIASPDLTEITLERQD